MAQEYGEQIKAAVIAALLEGQSVNSVARQYKIPRTTVSTWRNKADVSGSSVTDSKKEELGDLISDFLREALTTIQFQAKFFRNETWLQKQSAENAAVLFGVITDKAVRILEAAEAGANTAGDSETSPSTATD